MKYFNLFAKRQPYLNADDGTDLGGSADGEEGGTEIDSSTDIDANETDTSFMDDNGTDSDDTNADDDESTTNDENTDTADDNSDVNQQKNEQLFEIKYNGQTQKLTLQDLITNAQKGMNYDHVKQERDSFANSKENQVLDFYASLNGVTRTELVEQLMAEKEQLAINNEAAEIIQKSPGISEDLAKEIAELRLDKRQQKEREKETQKQADEQQKKNGVYKEFFDAYPEMIGKKFEELPGEVQAEIAKGKPPLVAYQAFEIKQLKAQSEANKQNAKNKIKSTGSIKNNAQDKELDDYFTQELFK